MSSVPAFAAPPLDSRVRELLSGYPQDLFTGRLHASIELTHRYALDQLSDALNITRDRPEGFEKALKCL